MSDFTNDFDVIFKDVVGKFELTEKEPEHSYDDVAKDLVRFASRVLQTSNEFSMYGINQLAYYIDYIKLQYERGVKHKCKCGTEISFTVEAEKVYCSTLATGEYYDFMTNRVISRRFCPICGSAIAVTGKIISMSAEGVNFNR